MSMLPEESIHVLIDEETLTARIRELGEQISRDYAGKELLVVCILRGGVMFMTELVKYLDLPVKMDFMTLSSYGDATTSSGRVKILKDMDECIENRHVLIVEDIVDTGRTLYCLKDMLGMRNPASLEICTMLDKPDRRVVELSPKYSGFVIPDKFVVGFGLDYQQYYRNLRYIAYVE